MRRQGKITTTKTIPGALLLGWPTASVPALCGPDVRCRYALELCRGKSLKVVWGLESKSLWQMRMSVFGCASLRTRWFARRHHDGGGVKSSGGSGAACVTLHVTRGLLHSSLLFPPGRPALCMFSSTVVADRSLESNFFYCYSGAVICGCRLRYKHGCFFFSHDDGCGAVNSFPGTQDGISLATLAPFSCFSTPQTDCCVSYHLQNATPDQFMLYHGKRSSIGKGALLRATHCRFRDVDNDSDSRQTGVAV